VKFKTLLALALAMAMSAHAFDPAIRKIARFAILNLPDSAYLQMEVRGFNDGYAPQIDSVKLTPTDSLDDAGGLVRRVGNLHVWWSVRETGDSGFHSHTVQILKALPFAPTSSTSAFEGVHALRINTLFNHEPDFATPARVTDIPHIDNSNTTPRILYANSMVCIDYELLSSKERLVQEFASLWSAKRFHAILAPATIIPYVYVSPWKQTTGTEDLPGIATPMVTNRGNWVDVQTQRFTASNVPGDTSGRASFSAEFIPIVKVDPVYELPTGFVRYVYNKVHNPDTKILETPGPWRIDSLYKIGPTLEVSGSTRDLENGDVPWVDSLMGTSSWLVLADSSLVSSVDSAMRPYFNPCGGRPRRSAWKIEGKTVWLDRSTSIDLAELLALATPTGVAHRDAALDGSLAKITRRSGGITIGLAKATTIRITNASGRVLRDRLELPAGSHAIDLGEAHGLVLVQATQGQRTETHRLVR